VTTALYRRYRPDTFDQVIGQDHVTVPLRAALRANRVTHAYLFSGPRGCGKTTSARILARCLNCAEGPTDTPCGHCDSCRELATGGPGSLDVVEMDAASHGGVDDARDLRERAAFAPVRDRYKVFIIDEAHMVTTQGFNALLKLVEEPPEHVKFVFATTEPDKVIGTIRSRTHHYPFRLVPPDILEPYLRSLCDQEGISVGDGVLNLVIRAGGGSVRDTLSVLDQLMAGAADQRLDYATTVALLGYTDSALLDQTVDALAGGDGAAVYRVIERMVESGHEPRRFVEDLLQRLRDLLIIAVAGDGADDVLAGTPADQLERMRVQARNWGPGPLSRAADLTDQSLRSMTGATSPRLQLELLIGRILVPAPGLTAADGQPGAGVGAFPGTVGMAGGGAPHSGSGTGGGAAHPPQEQDGPAGHRFGAAEAREQLRRARADQARPDAGAATPVPAGPVPSTPVARRPPDGARAGTGAPEPLVGGAGRALPGWDEPVAPVPGSETPPAGRETGGRGADSPTAAAPPVVPSAPAPAAPPVSGGAESPSGEPAPQEPAVPAGRDADMLRQRWPEVIQRLASISRATWSLVDQNAQLGGVDGAVAVVVFPTEGLVGAFVNGRRGVDVELAIHEATGLSLSVHAQVGQAGGGASVTTPTALPRPPEPSRRPAPARSAGSAQEPPEDTSDAGDDGEEPHPGGPAGAAGWPQARVPAGGAREPSPSPVPARMVREGPGLQAPAPDGPVFDGHAAVGEPAPEETDPEDSASAPRRPSDAAPSARADARAPAAAARASAPDPVWTGGWTEPVAVIPGSASGPAAAPVFDDEAVPVGRAEPPAHRETPAGRVPGTPSSGRSAPEGARQAEDAEESAPDADHPAVAAAQDMSASIDDADLESSTLIGLPAVLDILGGTVVEEIDEKED
jgi:DNA polymerase-3 subunit gamma/tau